MLLTFFFYLTAAEFLLSNVAASAVAVPHFHRRQASCNGPASLNTTTTTVTVQRGDTLSKLAARFNRGICDIAAANNISNVNLINVGQTLTIPPQVCNPDNTSCLPPPVVATATCVLGGPGVFVVQPGLALNQTAKFLNITLDSLVAANAKTVSNPASVPAGQVLNVPVCPGSSCTISQATIKQGDIFDDVAKRAGSTTGQILALNTGIDRLNLKVGQVFTLPSACTAGAAGNATM